METLLCSVGACLGWVNTYPCCPSKSHTAHTYENRQGHGPLYTDMELTEWNKTCKAITLPHCAPWVFKEIVWRVGVMLSLPFSCHYISTAVFLFYHWILCLCYSLGTPRGLWLQRPSVIELWAHGTPGHLRPISLFNTGQCLEFDEWLLKSTEHTHHVCHMGHNSHSRWGWWQHWSKEWGNGLHSELRGKKRFQQCWRIKFTSYWRKSHSCS